MSQTSAPKGSKELRPQPQLAEIESMNEVAGEYPICCWMMTFELDDERQTHLLKAIEKKVRPF
jgi:DNA replication and repair protein RecF